MLSELDKAYLLIDEKNIEEARNICLNLINNYPDLSVSYNALNLLKETYIANELSFTKDVYKSLFSKKERKPLYALAGLLLADLDKENKLKLIDEVMAGYKDDEISELALFNKFVYLYFELDEKENARAISEELDKQFPLSIDAVEAHRILGDEEYYKIEASPKQSIRKVSVQTPTEYDLNGNYPNPFNPTTTIKYALPADSRVEVLIYDIMGREVKTLVNGYNGIGYKEVMWDGRNNEGQQVSSGIYICRIKATSLEDLSVFDKSIKLLLMK
jgi:hypothetical protein